MDFIETKMIEIVQFNLDKIKEEENLTEPNENKLKNILEKVSGNFIITFAEIHII